MHGRAQAWLLVGLALALAVPALAAGQAGVDLDQGIVQPNTSSGGASATSAPSTPQLPGGTGTPPVGGDPGTIPGGPDLGLDERFAPDAGEVIWFTIGIGAGLIGLAAASLLGTRFVTAENVLENDARRAIFDYIRDNPGCHLRETAAALQLSTTNVLWHMRKLEESNLVNSKKLEGYKVFYPVEGGVEAKRMGLALAVLRNPNARQILGIIARNPGVHQREIARMLDVNHGTVRWHLKKLGTVELVLEVKKGSISQYYVSALGLMALERVEVHRPEVMEPPLAAEAGQPVQAEA